MNVFSWVLLILGVLALLILLISYALYRYALVRPRPRKKQKPPAKKWLPHMPRIHEGEAFLDALPSEQVQIFAQDGTPLHAVFYPSQRPEQGKVVLAIHGHKTDGKTNFSVFAKFFYQMGYALLIPDNRAHGNSGGKVIGFGWLDHKDCLLWMQYLRQRMGEPCKILLHGVSMGAATVLMAAGERPEKLQGVIADCGFTSALEEFRHVLHEYYHLPAIPFLPIASAICKLRAGYTFAQCSAREQLKKARVPILFIHGQRDRFVPTWMSEEMYRGYAGPKQLFLAPTADHATAYFLHQQEYEAAVRSFLARFLPEMQG